jgi:TnpA family transposase
MLSLIYIFSCIYIQVQLSRSVKMDRQMEYISSSSFSATGCASQHRSAHKCQTRSFDIERAHLIQSNRSRQSSPMTVLVVTHQNQVTPRLHAFGSHF